MEREEFDRLLAGYATNQLSQEETARLMEAAMADQSLFNALADEDALRAVVADPQMKGELLRALAPEEKRSFWSSIRRPQIWGLSGAVAVAVIAFVFMIQPRIEKQKEIKIARAPAPHAVLREVPSSFAPVKPNARAELKVQDSGELIAENRRPVKPSSPAIPAMEPLREDRVAQSKKVEVTAAAPQLQPAPAPPSAPAGMFRAEDAAPRAAKEKVAGAPQPVLRYTVLRRNEQGEFVESAPGALLDKGDAIRLAVTSTSRGYISLTEAGSNRPLHFGFVEAGVQYEVPATGAVPLDAAGAEKRLRLSLLTGVGNVSTQSGGTQSLLEQNAGNLANTQQNAGPVSQSTIDIVVRTR